MSLALVLLLLIEICSMNCSLKTWFFNCCNSFALSWVDKVTTGTWNFVSVVVAFVPLDSTYFEDHAKMTLIWQLILGISRVVQKLLKQFNGTTISTSFVPPPTALPVICYLNMNEALLLLAAGKHQ